MDTAVAGKGGGRRRRHARGGALRAYRPCRGLLHSVHRVRQRRQPRGSVLRPVYGMGRRTYGVRDARGRPLGMYAGAFHLDRALLRQQLRGPRRAVLAAPNPAWESLLVEHVPLVRWLTAEERTRLLGKVDVLLRRTRIEGCSGLGQRAGGSHQPLRRRQRRTPRIRASARHGGGCGRWDPHADRCVDVFQLGAHAHPGVRDAPAGRGARPSR